VSAHSVSNLTPQLGSNISKIQTQAQSTPQVPQKFNTIFNPTKKESDFFLKLEANKKKMKEKEPKFNIINTTEKKDKKPKFLKDPNVK